MQLDDNFILEGSANEWILKRVGTSKKGNEGERDRWYASDIRDSLKRYTIEATKPCEDAKAIMEKLNEIDKTINSLKVK